MITNVFVDVLNRAGLGLERASTLFAEQGRGERFVVVKTTANVPVSPGLPLRAASLQVIVRGWSHAEGYALAERIGRAVLAATGEHLFEAERYTVLSIVSRDHPVPFRDGSGALSFTMNFRVNHRVELA
ncbi:MAG: hypothetical protein ACLGPL_12520 [Acidobacteriota bacterium]